MNRKPTENDASLENDSVWKLLDLVPPPSAGARFVDDTVRAARLAGQPAPWWKRLTRPAPLAGLTSAAALIAFGLLALSRLPESPEAPVTHASFGHFLDSERAAEFQDIAETETLIAAADHLDDFSDTELVSLIGF